jgi:hypothetical protein
MLCELLCVSGVILPVTRPKSPIFTLPSSEKNILEGWRERGRRKEREGGRGRRQREGEEGERGRGRREDVY